MDVLGRFARFLQTAEDAAIANSDKIGKWVAFPHSRNRDKVAQITKALYDADIDAPCFVYSGEHGAYILRQNQVDAFFDSREEAVRYYEQENAKPSTIAKYLDGTPVADAATKSFDIYKDFDQNLFEWGAIREINRIRKAVAAKPKDSVVTDEEFVELNKPFHEAAKKYIADNGFSPDKKWVKTTVLSVPKAFANAFDTLSDGEGVSREHFLDVLTVEAVCALATEAVDSVRDIEDYYRKHNFKRDSDGNVLFHAPDFETPVTVEDADMRKPAKYTAVFAEDGRPETKVMLTSDLHTTDLDTLDPKDADVVVIAGDLMGAGTDSDDAGREYLDKKFCPWCEKHSDKEIVLTAGNHDKFLFRQWEKGEPVKWPKNVHYLVDRGATINGLKFYGTPWCLKNRPGRFEGTEESNREKYRKIPEGLDVLITHSPPYVPGEEVDANEDGIHEGSKELTEVILEKKPKLVVCGHVHSGSRKPVTLGDSEVVNVARVKRDRSKESVRPVFREVAPAQDEANSAALRYLKGVSGRP